MAARRKILGFAKKDGYTLVVLERPADQQFRLKNGVVRGAVAILAKGTAIDISPRPGSGQIYEIFRDKMGTRYNFADLAPFDETTDLKLTLKNRKRGTIRVNTESNSNTYQFDGGKLEPMTCDHTYFIMLNPHMEPNMSEAEACQLMNEAAAMRARVKPESKQAPAR